MILRDLMTELYVKLYPNTRKAVPKYVQTVKHVHVLFSEIWMFGHMETVPMSISPFRFCFEMHTLSEIVCVAGFREQPIVVVPEVESSTAEVDDTWPGMFNTKHVLRINVQLYIFTESMHIFM